MQTLCEMNLKRAFDSVLETVDGRLVIDWSIIWTLVHNKLQWSLKDSVWYKDRQFVGICGYQTCDWLVNLDSSSQTAPVICERHSLVQRPTIDTQLWLPNLLLVSWFELISQSAPVISWQKEFRTKSDNWYSTVVTWLAIGW